MNKQELIEAIEGTLASNGNKAITADALKALLLEVVDSIGEGGQGGGITLYVYAQEDENGNIIDLLTPEQVAHNKAQIDILTKLHDEGKPIPPIGFQNNIGEFQRAGVTTIMLYRTYIFWSDEGFPDEELPDGAIFPLVMNEFIPLPVNGDGTLLTMV